MAEVIPFPARQPVGEMMTVSMEEMMQVFTRQKSLHDIRIERLHEAHLNELRVFDIPDLRRFWDELHEDSFYHGPEGMFDCADIHRVLNEKGDGEYCAV